MVDVIAINSRLNGLVAIGTIDFTQNLFLNNRSISTSQLQSDLTDMSNIIFSNGCPTTFADYCTYFANLVSLILMRLSNIYTLASVPIDKNGVDYVIISYFYALGFRVTDYFPTWAYPIPGNIKRVWLFRTTDGTFTNGNLLNFDTFYIGDAVVSSFNYESVDLDLRMGIMNAFIELQQMIDSGRIVVKEGANYITDTNGALTH
ncbi:MAG: hypothetical protein WB421_17200 [Terriglobales bacterium]